MADENPSLHIDTDWKKQAQEEKRRLSEEQQKPSAPPPSAKPPASAGGATVPAGAARTPRDLPPASFATLVQSILTQVLFYLGDLAPRGAEPQINLDMAKHNIDMLGVVEEKTRGNISDDEKRMLDAALYETRMRYVAVASQYATV